MNESTQSESENSPPNGSNGAEATPGESSETAAPSDPIAELEQRAQEWENRYKYLYAEFENFKKRALKERIEFQKFGWEPLALDLIQVIDNMELALHHAGSGDKGIIDGLRMVLELFGKTLEKQGVRRVEAAGKPFDPNFHEAVAQEASDQHEAGTVIREQSSGYTLHGRLLRPARVVVAG